ncbi:MAG: hypothetical protein GC181_01485 [Bacteroidetes bacterium]|nr:hypothetical protein [Bacteroidota bacterium]
MAGSNTPTSLKDISPIQFINTFSVMVVVGIVATAYFFEQYFQSVMPTGYYWVLGSGVWMIYTLDHIRDGMKLKEESPFFRHRIHFELRKVLIPTIAALAVFNVIVVVMFFPVKMIMDGMYLAAFVALYFAIVHLTSLKNIGGLKELYVAVVVACGTVLFPALWGRFDGKIGDWLIFLMMVLMNLTNLILFSYFDEEGDKKSGLISWVTQKGKEKSRESIYMLMLSIFTLLTMYAFFIPHAGKISATVSILAMLNLLLMILQFEERFAQNEMFRFWGDFIYVIPILVHWFIAQDNLL